MAEPRGAEVMRLIQVMDVLRGPGGCPWDAEQTHESLLEYLLEEAYETVEAVDSGDRDALKEELGDVLLQVVFHSRIAHEHSVAPFDIDDVARGIADKLVRRHPHVFDEDHIDDGQDLHARWDRMKAAEKSRTSVTDGVPMAMPPVLLAVKLLSRASRSDTASAVPVAEPSAVAVASAALSEVSESAAAQVAVGELLLALVATASQGGVDVDAALRAAVHRYRDRLIAAEKAQPGT